MTYGSNMTSKSNRPSVISTNKTSNENVIPKKERSFVSNKSNNPKEVNETEEFPYRFKKLCLECKTDIIPAVQTIIVSESSTKYTYRLNHHRKSTTSDNATEPCPEVLAIKDSTTQVITAVLFQHFHVNKNMLIALLKTCMVQCYIKNLM